MADFKIEILLDGDRAQISLFDLDEKVKTFFTDTEIKQSPVLQTLVAKARIIKVAFINTRDSKSVTP